MFKHLKENNESYFSHMRFAARAGFYLAVSSLCYSVHALFPFISVPERFCFESVVNRCIDWHNYTVLRLRELEKEQAQIAAPEPKPEESEKKVTKEQVWPPTSRGTK